ncbi:MAG: NAD-dependent epimerase/dehydratase family protein [Candidatus Magasanikbacteria bacterium]|jgi:CDP-paratose 2-epimerase|nr:NAD-dependent epimerase/dehydratase family protein [Candidatus Magasanikbacteria bacterium]MBT4314809.1 NAD-dependent epimerase/dehydratase family protein [Candidatus Magasanikbacteria bacterium]MBT4547586.1 NAD-dependent epimerase/dehydratase family protein [Candidatus Magasanikbacteria bacterium]MBT6818835.1 NAD-dependent epimerase/dehydratase family protein [Candidatus Magasanikbacteria bacterium]
MKYLITGGCGFLGSNLSKEILQKGDELIIFDNLSRFGSEKNLEWLNTLGDFTFVQGDISKYGEIERVIIDERPDVVFHFAGQVAMTSSIEDPLLDFNTNALGTLNLLEAIRKHSSSTAVIYSSTNKVYGDLEHINFVEEERRYKSLDFSDGFDENIGLSFASPYGCSKGSADQYILDYNKVFGIKTAVMRHSSMYGSRQFSSKDQGWIGWFCAQAVSTKENPQREPFTISGNGKQVRDVLHADDMVDLYFLAAKNIEKIKGQVFNIGGGVENSLSLLELFDILEEELGVKLKYTNLPPRESDQKVFIADISKIERFLGWKPKVGKKEGIRSMLKWITDNKIF